MSRGVKKYKDIESKLYKYYRDQKALEQKMKQKVFYEESKTKLEKMIKCYAEDEKKCDELSVHINSVKKQLMNLQKDILVTDLSVKNIQIIISKLNDEEKKFIKWRYSDGMSLYAIIEKFHYSAPTYYRIRNKILERLQQDM
ncbi:hypothetical protein [Clostridium oryzae]|uniref:Transcriptional regulator n=1 Tax=Clostridium oryzae TaxID=1450648 RepID=A0A1V4I3T7_9CLOT|nr:hypothetical protein [Clostridium oryzae]OPJ54544.1 hypothetical protein CLORY_45680 [Clostridium oryzae]